MRIRLSAKNINTSLNHEKKDHHMNKILTWVSCLLAVGTASAFDFESGFNVQEGAVNKLIKTELLGTKTRVVPGAGTIVYAVHAAGVDFQNNLMVYKLVVDVSAQGYLLKRVSKTIEVAPEDMPFSALDGRIVA